jgi:hypothetical protein
MENDKLRSELLDATQKASESHMPAYFETFSRDRLSKEYDPCDWAIGPFERIDALTFEMKTQWKDPWNIGWVGNAIHNASLIEADGKLFMFYRCNPAMEALSARIGLAVYADATGWVDYENNPIIYKWSQKWNLPMDF